MLADELPIERTALEQPAQQAVPQLGVGARPDRQVQVGALAGGRAARIDVDDAHAALGPRHLDALVQHRVAPGGVGAHQHHQVGQLQVVVVLRHDVGAEGAAMPRHRRGHAQPRVGVDVRRADEALRQLVGDVVVLGQQLPGQVEGDRLRPMHVDDAAQAGRHMVERFVPADVAVADRRDAAAAPPAPASRRAPRPSSTACRSWPDARRRRRWPRRPPRPAWPSRRSRHRNRGRWCGSVAAFPSPHSSARERVRGEGQPQTAAQFCPSLLTVSP